MVGVVASFISVVQFCKDTISRIDGLLQNSADADTACQLTLLKKDIEVIGSLEYVKSLDADTRADLKRVLTRCQEQLLNLETLIKPLILSSPAYVYERAWRGVRGLC